MALLILAYLRFGGMMFVRLRASTNRPRTWIVVVTGWPAAEIGWGAGFAAGDGAGCGTEEVSIIASSKAPTGLMKWGRVKSPHDW